MRYEQRDEFDVRAREFLLAGLAAGERALYIAPDAPDVLVERVRATDALAEGLRRDAVRVASLEATYTAAAVVDPRTQVETYAAATEEALADGFTGLRVAADATSLVRTPAQLDAFARYEHLVDRYMATHPMSAMCAYDRAELGDDAIAQLACLHPEAGDGTSPFHLHAHAPAGAGAVLEGELDLESHELWPLALERADVPLDGGEVVIDATDLEFIDHRGLLALADHAERRGATVVLRTRLFHAAHLLRALDVRGVRVEQV
ncbi:MEDS domain-containing protein [Saccharothrix sp. Mg75]|uniref:MEDS domain-containing protein n=1 Tax=Saccharothrix sp. Mg75 TaxID=3445357 RepID=UPI003EED5594